MLSPNELAVLPIITGRFLSFTLAECSPERVNADLPNVFPGEFWEKFKVSQGTYYASSLYDEVPPAGGAHLFKILVNAVGLSRKRTLITTNVSDGWTSLSSALAKFHMGFQIQILSSQESSEFPIHKMRTWKNGASKRTVMALRDGERWVFDQEGEPEIFEKLDTYKKRIIKARFNREVIVRYMRELHLSVNSRRLDEVEARGSLYQEIRKK